MDLIKFLTDWRYRYWFKKIKGIKRMIEDEKFSRYKTYGLREEVRQEYDQEQAKFSNLEIKLKDKEKTISEIGEGEYKRLEDEKVRGEAKIKKLKEEIDISSESVEGSKPTNEHPAGIIGNNQIIEKLHDLIDFVKDYLKKI